MEKSIVLIILLSLLSWGNAQVCHADDLDVLERLFIKAEKEKWNKLERDSILVLVGMELVGTSYVGGTLSQAKEELIANLDSLDCTTFLEYTLAVTECIKNESLHYNSFYESLAKWRYRNADVSYSTRLHYFSSFIIEHSLSKRIMDYTEKLHGRPRKDSVNFMSSHAHLYKGLIDTNALKNIMFEEFRLNQHKRFLIEKSKVVDLQPKLKSGDIIGFTTSIKGLDFVHVGIIVMNQGQPHLLHASSDKKRVVISDKTISGYIESNKKQSGIVVLRLL